MARLSLSRRWYKRRVLPLKRPLILAFSLVLLSISVVLMADLLGLRSDGSEISRESRKVVVEALAVQLSTLASQNDLQDIQTTISRFVLRNGDIHAAALVRDTGFVVAKFGDEIHLDLSESASTASQLQVPIYDQNHLWGAVLVKFAPVTLRREEIVWLGFFALGSMVAFTAFLFRVLVQLDPGSAVPGRVDTAMNLFSAGVIVLDAKLRIVLANLAAADIAQQSSTELQGQTLDEWSWRKHDDWQAPWATTLHSGLAISDEPLCLLGNSGEERSFLVSCSFIGDGTEERKGVLVTLDEMTQVERKNFELTTIVEKLRQSQELINRKNEELRLLATTDPLTGAANRRTLLEALAEQLKHSNPENAPLSCIMIDIDHFKKVNDNYGHAVGDEVIKATAQVLQGLCRDVDILGRYGGEEFVWVLPGIDATASAQIANRARIAINELARREQLPVPELSASFGVSDLSSKPKNAAALIDSADKGLYKAKQSGRNRVVIYDAEALEGNTEEGDISVPEDDAKWAESQSTDLDRMYAQVLELEGMLKLREQELNEMRNYDALTGIPLRSIFTQRAEGELFRAARDKTIVGVISIGLRDMDRIVSTFGSAEADSLVISVVSRLQEGLRNSDMVSLLSSEHSLSRISLNEYAVLLSDLRDATSAMVVVTRLKRLLAEPFIIADEKVYIGTDIGISVSSRSNTQVASLIAAASDARKAASFKQDKISHVFASDKLNNASNDYIRLESDLREALDNGSLETWFQPKFDLKQRRITGMEALTRWRHATRGYVSPQLFVSIAEANGLIDKLSQRSLLATLEQLVVWRSMGFDDLKVSVNISPMQLRAENLVQEMIQALNNSGVKGKQLEIELTETTVLANPERAREALETLREVGVGVSIDDFGTGYTSLSLLAELPLDVVKIDRLFITAIETSERSRAVVASVINMAHALNLRVVAEGVETNNQLEILNQLECDEIQGYLISQPQTADKITRILVDQLNGDNLRYCA